MSCANRGEKCQLLRCQGTLGQTSVGGQVNKEGRVRVTRYKAQKKKKKKEINKQADRPGERF